VYIQALKLCRNIYATTGMNFRCRNVYLRRHHTHKRMQGFSIAIGKLCELEKLLKEMQMLKNLQI
jgi:hypothetical protein